jgi:hypothetical protein
MKDEDNEDDEEEEDIGGWVISILDDEDGMATDDEPAATNEEQVLLDRLELMNRNPDLWQAMLDREEAQRAEEEARKAAAEAEAARLEAEAVRIRNGTAQWPEMQHDGRGMIGGGSRAPVVRDPRVQTTDGALYVFCCFYARKARCRYNDKCKFIHGRKSVTNADHQAIISGKVRLICDRIATHGECNHAREHR